MKKLACTVDPSVELYVRYATSGADDAERPVPPEERCRTCGEVVRFGYEFIELATGKRLGLYHGGACLPASAAMAKGVFRCPSSPVPSAARRSKRSMPCKRTDLTRTAAKRAASRRRTGAFPRTSWICPTTSRSL